MKWWWRIVVLQGMAGLFWLVWLLLDTRISAAEQAASGVMVIAWSVVCAVIGLALEADQRATAAEAERKRQVPLVLSGGVKPLP